MKKLLSVAFATIAASLFANQYETTGAAVSTDGDAEIYTWTETNTVGTIVVPEGGALFDILLVGGGGAGGWCRGGGGGGGGVVYQTGVFFPEGTYSIAIGAGGVPDKNTQSYAAPKSTERTNGRPTTISNETEQVRIAYGGGGGATYVSGKGGALVAGASSGGESGAGKVPPDVSGGQGYRGGSSANEQGGGGGGAGGPGGNAVDLVSAGVGGIGFLCGITGSNVRYGGGGGGGVFAGTAGAGGDGGGGHGGSGSGNPNLTPGVDGLGGGGGGAGGNANSAANCGGARGGNGIVILRTASASRPSFSPVDLTITDGTNVTFSAILQGMGTNPGGSASATGCALYFAYGTDPDNLVSEIVKSGWNLGDPQWIMTVTDIPAYSKFYWRAALTNEFGVGADDVQGGYNLTTGLGAALPLKVGFSDPTTAIFEGKNNIGYYDMLALVDGVVSRACNLALNGTPDILFDAGEEKTVRLVRAYYEGEVSGVTNKVEGFELYGSNDREDWTKIADANGFVFGLAARSWMEAPVVNHAPYRYYEMRGVPNANLGELELVSDDLSVRFDKPQFYVDNSLASAYDPDGVTISGKITKSPSAETEVYGYYARVDYDCDETAWAANGTKFMLSGAFASGATFSQKIQIPGRGNRFVRLFARAGAASTSSQRSWEIGLKTSPKVVPAYLTSTPDFNKIYDGNVADGYDDGNSVSIIFDLRGLDSLESLSHLRIWPVMGQYNQYTWTRTRVGKVYVSYDDAEVTKKGDTLVPGREVYSIEAAPAVTWTCVKPYLDDMANIHSSTECVYLGLPRKPRPTFLKIGNFYRENCCEIEFRVTDDTPGLMLLIK